MKTKKKTRVESVENGIFWRVFLSGGKGNVIDSVMTAELQDVFREAAVARELRALSLEAEGPDFSYGVSIEDHLPERVAAMLSGFHAAIDAMLDASVVLLAAVDGRCLGGGLELASLCHRIFASEDATFGQPEIALGVFAPVASIVVRERVGEGDASDLCLTGRSVSAREALAMGLVDEVVSDPSEAALAYARQHLLSRSASSLRFAVKAARAGLQSRLRRELPAVERLYLDELMKTHDAVEGLRAFLEKRPPRWENC